MKARYERKGKEIQKEKQYSKLCNYEVIGNIVDYNEE